jgi:hypothetical protein
MAGVPDEAGLRELAVEAVRAEQAMVGAFRPQPVGPAPTPYWRKKNEKLEKM